MIVILLLIAAVVGFLLSLLEAFLVHWIGPYTGINYFDTATYWNCFFLVLIGNIVAGGASVSAKSSK